MKLILTAVSSSIIMMLSGCAQSGVPVVDADASRYELTSQTGVITDIRAVVVKDEGSGGFLGAIVGGVLGSTMGGGRGSVLTTLGGGLIGAYAGNEIGKSNAQELSVTLNTNQDVVVVSKGTEFTVGQRVKIVKRNGRIYNVELAK
ncbi:MAG: glycine zipper 2TM domain-containing protein [Sulfuricurvum sp.]|nr:glycine zipper 2TM domain-containing protein [Sulfuricurvum sp.]